MPSTLAVFTDYTNRFSQYRSDSLRSRKSSILGKDSASQHLLSSSSEVAIDTSVVPAWVEKQKEVEAELVQIQSFMDNLQTEQSRDLTTSFGNDRKIRTRVDALTSRITQSFQLVERKIKSISNYPSAIPSEVKVVRDNVVQSLASKATQLSQTFRQRQKSYLSAIKSFDEEVDIGFTENQNAQATLFADLVEEHSTEINNITEQLENIAGIFRDMSALVVEQGSLIDQIDVNIEMAEKDTASALNHLENAADRLRRKRLNYCIMLQFVIVFVLFIVYWTRR
ncbi:hypothetical protein P9112_011191 [Eukaryota sp. TZLM1-RC]